MTEKPVKKLKGKKLPSIQEKESFEPLQELSEPVAVKKPRPSRAKAKPTKQEAMSMLLNTSKELNQIIDDLKEDAAKIGGIQFKKLTVLIEETLQNLKDDNDEIMDKYKELESLPETKSE